MCISLTVGLLLLTYVTRAWRALFSGVRSSDAGGPESIWVQIQTISRKASKCSTKYTASLVLITCATLAGPNTHNTVFAALSEVPILDSDFLHRRWLLPILFCCHTSTTFPMSPIRLVVDLDDIFPRSGDDPSRVKHHACYRIVVRIGIVDGPCPKIPDLYEMLLACIRRS